MSKTKIEKEIEEIITFIENMGEVISVEKGTENNFVQDNSIPDKFDTEADRVLVINRHPSNAHIVDEKLKERFDTEDASYVGNLLNADMRHIITVRETRSERGLEPLD